MLVKSEYCVCLCYAVLLFFHRITYSSSDALSVYLVAIIYGQGMIPLQCLEVSLDKTKYPVKMAYIADTVSFTAW